LTIGIYLRLLKLQLKLTSNLQRSPLDVDRISTLSALASLASEPITVVY